MKATGITRKVDELGRVVVPIELRRMMNIDVGDPLEIYTDNEQIILKKYEPQLECAVTGDTSLKNMLLAGGKIVLSHKGAQALIDEIEAKMEAQNNDQ